MFHRKTLSLSLSLSHPSLSLKCVPVCVVRQARLSQLFVGWKKNTNVPDLSWHTKPFAVGRFVRSSYFVRIVPNISRRSPSSFVTRHRHTVHNRFSSVRILRTYSTTSVQPCHPYKLRYIRLVYFLLNTPQEHHTRARARTHTYI